MNWLRKFVDVRAGELRPVALATSILFAMVAGHTMLETARDALFLNKLSPTRLPFVYAALAGLAVVAVSASNRLVAYAGRRNALVSTLMLAVYGTFLFYLLPNTDITVFALYLWSGLIGSVVIIQFWIFSSQLFTVEQGKRVFGFLAAGGALGALVGAGGSVFLLRIIPLKGLLATGAGMFLLAGLILTSFGASSGATESSLSLARRAPGETTKPEKLGLGSLLKTYPYLWRLGALIVVATVTVLVVDYMFKQSAARRLEPEELGEFFATYYAIFSAASLLFQVALAGFLLKRIGVLASLSVMPILLAIGGGATAILGGVLIAATATKGVDGALRHSLHRVSTELLWMPLPGRARAAAKGILDAGLSRGVQAATAAGLLGLAAVGADNTVVLSIIVSSLALLWIIIALALRKPYIDLYRSGLARTQTSSLVSLNLKLLEVLVEALSSANDQEVIAAMKLLASKERVRLIPSLILYHGSPPVLLEALGLVATPDRDDWIPIAIKLLDSESDAVRAEAVRALARREKLPDLADRVLDISSGVRGQAIFWQIQNDEMVDDATGHPAVMRLIESDSEADRQALEALLGAVATDGDSRWASIVMTCLESPDPVLARHAVQATGALRDPRFLGVLIKQLGNRRGRPQVRQALLAIGPRALDALDLAFRDPQTQRRVRIHLARSISLFRSNRAAFLLLEQLARERSGGVRFRILSAAARLVSDLGLAAPLEPILDQLDRDVREYFRLLALVAPLERQTYEMPSEAAESAGLLFGLIEDKKKQSIERCFLALQIAHPREDVAGIQEAIASREPRSRANALEFVDNLMLKFRRLDRGNAVRDGLRLALDALTTPAKLKRAGDWVKSAPKTYDESVLAFARDDDETTASIAVYHALLLDVEHLRVDVAAAVQKRPLLDPLGAELHERLTKGAAAK